MSLSPETFERDLKHRLGDDYRLRWSDARSSWMIEQRVGRGIWDMPRSSHADPQHDRLVRARDGYALACEIQPRPFVVCETCHGMIPVAELDLKETWCRRCEAKGLKPRHRFLGHYPLGERLLARLERTSPKRAGKWQQEIAEANRVLAETKQRDHDRETEDVLADHFNRIADIPQSGYGGTIPRRNLLD